MRTSLRPEPKPDSRMMIENDSLYSDGCLIKMTCQALNTLNGIDLNTEETGIQFKAEEEHSPHPHSQHEQLVQFQGELQDCNIDHLLNLDSGGEGEPREQALLHGSYIEESSTLFYLRGCQKERYQGRQIINDSPASPIEFPKAQWRKADTKNITCYISRFVSRAMLNRYQGFLKARCTRAGVCWNEFKEFCDPSKFKGINSLLPFFSPGLNEAERRKKEIFTHLFQKILRRHYLRLIEGQGHMTSRELYIQFKNKQLLYCESALPS